MVAVNDLKNKKKIFESNYHQFLKGFESNYELIYGRITSRFHREKAETELIRSKISNLVIKSSISFENTIKPERFVPIFSGMSTKNDDKFSTDILDWIRGRFSGQTVRIIVRNGEIIEKIFLTPRGNRISIKRSKIELWIRSMPTLRINLRLRLRSMPTIFLNLRSLAAQ